MIYNILNLDEKCTWYVVPNASIQRPEKGKTRQFGQPHRNKPHPNPTKPHPVLLIGVFTQTPEGRITCVVRSSTFETALEHYKHTKCERTCKIDLNGYLDEKYVWSVPESLCNPNTYSCAEPSDSYLLDEIEETFAWLR